MILDRAAAQAMIDTAAHYHVLLTPVGVEVRLNGWTIYVTYPDNTEPTIDLEEMKIR